MEIKASEQAGVALLELRGSVDGRGALDFERKVVELLGAGTRLFAIDFAKVELITSAGIRVLMMLAKRLHASNGKLVLCSLSEQVTTVFDIAGLTQQFRIASSHQDAMAQLTAPSPIESGTPLSRISRLVTRLLGGEADAGGSAKGSRPGRAPDSGSELSARVAELLTGSADRGSGSSSVGRRDTSTPVGRERP